jgi:hypothetical protein
MRSVGHSQTSPGPEAPSRNEPLQYGRCRASPVPRNLHHVLGSGQSAPQRMTSQNRQKTGPGGEIGRRKGLKILWPYGSCGFESHPGHQSTIGNQWGEGSGVPHHAANASRSPKGTCAANRRRSPDPPTPLRPHQPNTLPAGRQRPRRARGRLPHFNEPGSLNLGANQHPQPPFSTRRRP